MDEDFIVWDNALNVGYDLIDDQHKGLVAMINDLMAGCKKGAVAADIAFMEVLEKTVDYAKTHFAAEEKILSQISYPDLSAHKDKHFQFLFEVVNIISEVESGSTTPINMVLFLKNWLMGHIAVCDKEYVPYLKNLERSKRRL